MITTDPLAKPFARYGFLLMSLDVQAKWTIPSLVNVAISGHAETGLRYPLCHLRIATRMQLQSSVSNLVTLGAEELAKAHSWP